MAFVAHEVSLASGTVRYFDAGSGPPVLYLHNAAGVRLSPALERLSETRRLVVPVAPGFDGSAVHPSLRSMADLADLTAGLIDAVVKGPCDVIGHSLGGWLAVWLAVRHPDKVLQLVLSAPAGFRPEGEGGLEGDPAKLRQLMFAHPENLPPDVKPPAVQAQNRAMLEHYHATEATDLDLAARLGEIAALTLILHGNKDGVIPIASPRLLKERIRQSHLVYVDDAAHAIDTDQPERFVRLVRDFLDRGEAFIVNRKAETAA